MPFLIFFPPRLVTPDFSKGDENAILDDARDRYLDQGLPLVEGENLKKAQIIVGYASGFPEVMKMPD